MRGDRVGAPALEDLVGLVADGGMMLAARRSLLNLSDAAARAGASSSAVPTEGAAGSHVPDRAIADAAVHSYLAKVGFEGEAEVGVMAAGVSVRLSEEQHPMFGRLFGLSTVTLHAESEASSRASQAGS